jgi:hypothetical protein
MSYLAMFFVALLIIYLSECCAWVPNDVVVFKVSEMGAKVATPIFVFLGIKRSVVLGPLLPGAVGVAVCKAESLYGTTGDHRLDRTKLLDTRKIARVWRLYLGHTNLLVFETQIQTLLVFLFAPWVAFAISPYVLVYMLPIWLSLQIHITCLFVVLTKRSFFRPKERGAEVATMLLSPPFALRAADLILRNLFSNFHWLAVAKVVCSADYALGLTLDYLRKLEFPTPAEREASDLTPETSLLWKQTVWSFVFQEYGNVQLLPPSPASADAERYCPRCCSQFTRAAETCHECGIGLMSFSDRSDVEQK